MSTFVLLSSSPPRVFAKSPTVAQSSSPSLPSPTDVCRSQSQRSPRFKTSNASREGFADGFTSARFRLQQKNGAENIPLKRTTPNKPKVATKQIDQNDILIIRQNDSPWEIPSSSPDICELPNNSTKPFQRTVANDIQYTEHGKEQLRENLLESYNQALAEPQLPEKAVPRRTEWTPVKDTSRETHADNSPLTERVSFPKGLLQSFEYCGDVRDPLAAQDVAVNPPKRRRLAPVVGSENKKSKTQREKATKSAIPAPSKRQTKSPTKKSLTITELATSLYRGQTTVQETPMMQYLTSTQAPTVYDSIEICNGGDKKKGTTTKRRKSTKKNEVKSRLLSPKSAMKTLEEQETLFGSASQLARDESPRLTRDTLEALKLSTNLMSDPISTQQTQPISFQTTPRAVRGTSRFVKARNLWAAAGRDEDNALLQVETVDLTDSPAVRQAFAGKDVLVEPGSASISTSKYKPIPRHAFSAVQEISPIPQSNGTGFYDIDEFTTPTNTIKTGALGTIQKRAYHSSALGKHEDKSTETLPKSDAAGSAKTATEAEAVVQPNIARPVKPSYSGFSTHDLQKKISAYGFKPVKKREKMIELLDRCWEDKYGPSELPAGNDTATISEPLKHGDFLSKVHDISTRPVPKAKKSKAEPKKGEVKETKSSTGNKSRSSKKKLGKTPAAVIVDIDEMDHSAQTDTPKAIEKAQDDTVVTITPPATAFTIVNSKSTEDQQIIHDAANQLPTPMTTPPQTDVNEQIKRAILEDSKASLHRQHNHVKSPTWHEKILMYDPIILEDLTTWLNTQGLSRIGEDRELSAVEVRSWCESNGICCLWRGGWRGQKFHGSQD